MDHRRIQEKTSGIDLSKQPDAVQRIKEESEKAKIALSSTQEYEINLPFVTADQTGPKHIQKKLTRSKLEQLTDDLFQRTVKPVKDCLNDAKWSASAINELVLVGGMTRMPKVIDTARSLIGKEPHKGVNPDEVVAVGAAIQGGVLKGEVKDVLLLDVTPLSPRDRNGRRHCHGDDPTQYHHSYAEVADLLDAIATASREWKSKCCKASARSVVTTSSWAPFTLTAFLRRLEACRRSR